MADKMWIIFRNETGGGQASEPMAGEGYQVASETTPKTTQAPTPKTAPKASMGMGTKALIAGTTVMTAKQAAQLVTSSVGMVTGDSLKQSKVNTSLKMGAYALALTNPATAPIAVVGLTVDAANYAISEKYRKIQENSEITAAKQYQDLTTNSQGRAR